MKGGHEVVVIREVLEGMVRSDVAGTVLFEALEASGEEPNDVDAWLQFVGGPLRRALRERATGDETDVVIGRIAEILGQIRPSSPDRPVRRSQAPTGRFPISEGPSRLLVFAASHRLGRRLKASLGANVAPFVFDDLTRLKDLGHDFEPQLLVIDLTDTPSAGLDQIAAQASKILDSEVITVVWDEGSRIGQAVTTAFEEAGRRVSWIDRRGGVDPLIDLIRACRGAD